MTGAIAPSPAPRRADAAPPARSSPDDAFAALFGTVGNPAAAPGKSLPGTTPPADPPTPSIATDAALASEGQTTGDEAPSKAVAPSIGPAENHALPLIADNGLALVPADTPEEAATPGSQTKPEKDDRPIPPPSEGICALAVLAPPVSPLAIAPAPSGGDAAPLSDAPSEAQRGREVAATPTVEPAALQTAAPLHRAGETSLAQPPPNPPTSAAPVSQQSVLDPKPPQPSPPTPVAPTPPPAAAIAAPAIVLAAPFDTAALLARRTSARVAVKAIADAAPMPLAPGAITTGGALAATAPIAPGAPVDVARATWPAAMIDRIEHLRDAADAVSTSIRLIPDALGAVDVSVRREGEVTHVHLAAEQPATRALLADAQPKLAEIAEQRGLKLGQTEVGGGGGDPRRHTPSDQPAPRRAPFAAVAVRPAPDDIRIA